MTPEFFREQQLMRGAVGPGTPTVVTPATVFVSQVFGNVTPDLAAGGSVFVAGYEIARSGDTSLPVTVGVAISGRAPTPLVAGDVQGGLSDVTYTIPAGVSRLPLSFSFPAQDLTADHYGRVQLHGASVPIVGDGKFDFILVRNTTNPPVGNYALSPDYRVRAAKHQAGGADSLVTQLAAGLGAQLKGGSVVGDDTNGLALWFTRRTTLDWDMSFTTKKLDATTPVGNALTEEMLLVYFGCTGNGGSFPADVSAWPATTNPWSHNYRANLKGAALTLYNQTDAAATVAHTVALGIFKGDDTRTNVAGTTTFPFVQNTVYTWTIRRRGETVTVSATDGATTWSDSFTAPAGATLATNADAGNIGLVVSPQRQIEVGDLTVTDGIAVTPAYALIPRWGDKWVQHTTPTGVVRQLAGGVELAAGDAITADNATLVSKDLHTSGAAGPVTPGAAPLKDWTAAADLLPGSDPNYIPIKTVADMAKLGTMAAGKQYVLVNDINLGGKNFDLAGGNLTGAACYFRGSSPGRVVGAYPTLSNGSLTLKCSNSIIREMALDGVQVLLGKGWNTVQVESNWFSGIDLGMDVGFVHGDQGKSQGTGLLIAFNFFKARPGKEISGSIFRLQGPASKTNPNPPPEKFLVPCEASNIRIAFNHYHRLHTGPYIGDISAGSKIMMVGDNPWNDFEDQKGEFDHNLATDWTSSSQAIEMKIAGWKIHDNTWEMGTPVPYGPKKIIKNNCMGTKLRHSRVTSDPGANILTGYSFDVYGNLSVFKSASAQQSVHDMRDGFILVINNWAVVLGQGQQPPAWGSAVAGPLSIQLNDGHLDWRIYPDNDVPGGGSNWPNCGKCMVGGNFASVQVGEPSPGVNIGGDENRVAPGTGGRSDRNRVMKITKDKPGHPTDQTTPVPGADVAIVPHRMQAVENGFSGTPEVGVAAWNAAAYGGGGGGSGDIDVSFDYTCTASPAATDATGCASLFYCHMVGQGAYPADMSQWSSAQWGAAGDTEYQPHANWFRFTFNTLNTVTPAISNKARLVVVSGGVLTRPNPNETQLDFFFPVGTKYRLRCQKNGNDFSFTQTDAAGGVKTQTWTDATAGAMNTGNFMWRFQPARHGKIENLTVA
jgi:hypothetical protein